MDNTVWQPEYLSDPSYEFAVRVDGDFSQSLREHTVPAEYRENLNTFIGDHVLPEFGITYTDPIHFYDGTFQATSFHIGNNGTWLATDQADHGDTAEDVVYHSHNVDTGHEAYALMAVVDQWAKTAALLHAEN